MTTEGLFRGPGLASQLPSVLSLTPGAQTTNQKQTGEDRGTVWKYRSLRLRALLRNASVFVEFGSQLFSPLPSPTPMLVSGL